MGSKLPVRNDADYRQITLALVTSLNVVNTAAFLDRVFGNIRGVVFTAVIRIAKGSKSENDPSRASPDVSFYGSVV